MTNNLDKLFILILFFSLTISSSIGQAVNLKSLDQTGDPRIEMQLKVEHFTDATNNFLNKEISINQFNQFMMNEQDIQYWAGQFNITENVKEEDVYNKLESISIEAKTNLTKALHDADRIEVGKSDISLGKDPRLRVNKAANLVVHFIKNDAVINAMQLTLIDVRGELKLIKAK